MGKPVVVAEFDKSRTERARVSLETFRGHNLVDVRCCVQLTESSGIWTPTKKGLSLRVEHLGVLREALAKAEEQARAMGWLEVSE